jgi:hypothetical protein
MKSNNINCNLTGCKFSNKTKCLVKSPSLIIQSDKKVQCGSFKYKLEPGHYWIEIEDSGIPRIGLYSYNMCKFHIIGSEIMYDIEDIKVLSEKINHPIIIE